MISGSVYVRLLRRRRGGQSEHWSGDTDSVYDERMAHHHTPIRIGFDLGGTKMLCGAIASDGSVIATKKKKTKELSDPDALLDRIVRCVDGCLKKAGLERNDVAEMGVAAPGPIDSKAGVLLETPNLGLREFPMARLLRDRLGFPVFLENDVNAGLYGEYRHGGAGGYRNIVGLFPGTGIGGAMIFDGVLYRGATGGAGELGHMIVEPGGRICGCGRRGCLEAVAGRGAMAREATLLVISGKAPTIEAGAGTDVSRMKSSIFLDAIENGEEAVIELVDRAAWWLGVGMANCVNAFNPDVIVLGGGLVEKLGERYVAAAERSMREHAMEFLVRQVKIVTAELGDDAAVVGAAELATEANARA